MTTQATLCFDDIQIGTADGISQSHQAFFTVSDVFFEEIDFREHLGVD